MSFSSTSLLTELIGTYWVSGVCSRQLCCKPQMAVSLANFRAYVSIRSTH
jgi:hypothetical protein